MCDTQRAPLRFLPLPPFLCSFEEFVRMAQDNIFLTGKLQEYSKAFKCEQLPRSCLLRRRALCAP